MLTTTCKYVTAKVDRHILDNVEVRGVTVSIRIGTGGIISAEKKRAAALVDRILIYVGLDEAIPIRECINDNSALKYYEGICSLVKILNGKITVSGANVSENV